jgi:hypothetical protein
MESPTPPVSKKMLWTGRIMSTLPVLLLLFSAATKFSTAPQITEGFAKMGWSMNLAAILGILEIACTVIYLVPRTAILGAILLTGYLGGAIATSVRIGESWYIQLALGVLLWGGLYLRDSRLRALIPLRRAA